MNAQLLKLFRQSRNRVKILGFGRFLGLFGQAPQGLEEKPRHT